MVNDSIYQIDYEKLVTKLTPGRIGKAVLLAWLNVLVSPVVFAYQAFLRFRKARVYELGITPQVCSLERLLNDRYDAVLRRIYIDDAVVQSALYIYTDAEPHVIDLFTDPEGQPVDLYTDGESGGLLGDDFIVMVPVSLVFNSTEMRSLINVYRLAGMKFKIQTF